MASQPGGHITAVTASAGGRSVALKMQTIPKGGSYTAPSSTTMAPCKRVQVVSLGVWRPRVRCRSGLRPARARSRTEEPRRSSPKEKSASGYVLLSAGGPSTGAEELSSSLTVLTCPS